MIVPTDRHYTAEHEWITVGGDVATVGITAFAADSLGDIVYVDLPPAGAALIAGRPCGEIESTKSVSDLYAPVDGSVLDVNPLLADEPSLLNQDPFGAGWLLRVRIDGSIDGRALLDATAYAALIRDAG